MGAGLLLSSDIENHLDDDGFLGVFGYWCLEIWHGSCELIGGAEIAWQVNSTLKMKKPRSLGLMDLFVYIFLFHDIGAQHWVAVAVNVENGASFVFIEDFRMDNNDSTIWEIRIAFENL
ncbi:hypothetical protein SLEP1_g54906 [Rubroshorea leprosula]|uniref:Ubiquitin-like protease family profile domain-containing protein n=1 Tax=Rubroshorea leprosula TaxID=152421 RepID=A0AAV5MDV4_9ROSI|nr:hypothetical protein SLEP1_g54906 [Rubroshorea leprosula]